MTADETLQSAAWHGADDRTGSRWSSCGFRGWCDGVPGDVNRPGFRGHSTPASKSRFSTTAVKNPGTFALPLKLPFQGQSPEATPLLYQTTSSATRLRIAGTSPWPNAV